MARPGDPSRILVIKTSSLGDVVHCLPALTDAHRQRPELRFDWLVEEDYAFLPALHPAVDQVIPVAVRRWRRSLTSIESWREFGRFRGLARQRAYELVIDAQGLYKSALLGLLCRGPMQGFDRASIREPGAAGFYAMGHGVPRNLHAVERLRWLFAAALEYPRPDSAPDYGLRPRQASPGRRLLFAHGTTWPSKRWPWTHWRELAVLAGRHGYEVSLPWGDAEERARAEAIAKGLSHVRVLPRLSLGALFDQLAIMDGVVAVDTGLCHLAAALNVPALALYGATDPALTGNYGPRQLALVPNALQCTPCLQRTCRLPDDGRCHPPCLRAADLATLWDRLQALMAPAGSEV